ncbi:IS3 family transposase [Micromonospora sp. CA-248260]|uniref:IS3 family transposase n=1 Tax=Micromonospora sp. CA-248260 TaxID=3239962 RepID=UPI003D93164C
MRGARSRRRVHGTRYGFARVAGMSRAGQGGPVVSGGAAGQAVEIAEIHDVSDGTYGNPRVHARLRHQGRHVGRK